MKYNKIFDIPIILILVFAFSGCLNYGCTEKLRSGYISKGCEEDFQIDTDIITLDRLPDNYYEKASAVYERVSKSISGEFSLV